MRVRRLNGLLIGALFATLLVSILVGAAFSPMELLEYARGSSTSPFIGVALTEVRLPRTIAVALAGAAIALAGALLQSTFMHPLADASLLGIASAAGASFAVVYSLTNQFLLAVFAAGIVSALALIWLAGKRLSVGELLVAAIALGALMTSVLGVVASSPRLNSGRSVTAWVLGSFATVTWEQASALLLAIFLCALFVFRHHRYLDLLGIFSLGAVYVGVDVAKLRRLQIFVSSGLIAASVAAGGVIAFLGLIAPLLIRSIGVMGSRDVYWLSAVCGSTLLLTSDVIARSIFSPFEVPISIILGLVAGPILLFSVLRNRSGNV